MYSVPYLALIYYSLIFGGASASRPEDVGYKSTWVELDGLDAHYIEAGSGEPLVLVHGGLAWSSGEVNYGDVVSITTPPATQVYRPQNTTPTSTMSPQLPLEEENVP